MSEMVERVARAFHGVVMAEDPEQPPWDRLSETFKDYCRKHARAAIEAMRIPQSPGFCPNIEIDVFNRFLDEALK